MQRIVKESRRLGFQLRNLLRYGRLNPYGHTRRGRKPPILKRHPELEIDSLLEFVIAGLGKPADDFFFVQIGAFDGISDGWFRTLITDNHWRGILVEPQPGAFAKLQQTYSDQPQLTFRNVAIGAKTGEATMYTMRTGPSQVTSFHYQHLVRHLKQTADIVPIKVPCLTLTDLLSQAGCRTLDLLQIDAEGYDAEIIRSLDFRVIKPSIIRYEHRNLLSNDHSKLIEQLAEHGYRFMLEDANTIACLPQDCCLHGQRPATARSNSLKVA
ncbi:MAG: FkbM family methyltransferase [Planctomycetes bacterium]|nr:FkbM family methyltransferase [Planctomycetota bacterium]